MQFNIVEHLNQADFGFRVHLVLIGVIGEDAHELGQADHQVLDNHLPGVELRLERFTHHIFDEQLEGSVCL
ncbi:hypothetical protein D3C76_1369530 [compost metagenome]